MLLRNQRFPHATLLALAVGLPGAGCSLTGDIETGVQGQRSRGGDDFPEPPPIPVECKTLDFDFDSTGAEIPTGRILTDVYAGDGVTIKAFRDRKGREHGLPVAFDSDNPTGGDHDLAFELQGNLLISQECFDDEDIARGFVSEPDDNASGARFEFTFETPVCIPGLTLLDIDENEDPAYIKFFDAAGNRIFETAVAPTGDGHLVDVVLPHHDECNVSKAVIKLSGSGAVDDVQICDTPDAGDDVFEDDPALDGEQTGTGVAVDGWNNVFSTGVDQGAVFLRKLGPNGAVLFQNRIPVDVDQGADVELALLEQTNPVVFATTASGELYLAEFDNDGGLEREIPLGALGQATAVDVTTLGTDIYFAANVAASGDVVVGKVEADGNVELSAPFDSGATDIGAAIAADPVTGTIAVAVNNGADPFVARFDSNLNALETIPLAGPLDPDFGVVTGVAYGPTGHLLVVGDDQGLPTVTRVLEFDDDALVNEARFDNNSDDDASIGIVVDAVGNVIIAGSALIDGDLDVWVRKLDSSLTPQFSRVFDLGGDDIVEDLAVDAGGNILVSGTTDGDGSDFFTIKVAR